MLARPFFRTRWTGVDLHHDPVDLGLGEVELGEELEVLALGLLQLAERLGDGLVVLALVVDGVGQDEPNVEGRVRARRRGRAGPTLEYGERG